MSPPSNANSALTFSAVGLDWHLYSKQDSKIARIGLGVVLEISGVWSSGRQKRQV